jgi:hypothetical protein
MAFVWALAALNYPELKKRLLASSVIVKSQKPFLCLQNGLNGIEQNRK